MFQILCKVPARISACLADISAWMSTHHLKLNGQESWGNPGQPAVILEPYCSEHSYLPFLPPQHPEDPIVPHQRGHSTPGPGPGDLTSRLLQFLAGRPSGLRHQATATSPERCHSSGVQPAEVHPRHPSTLLSALAPHRSTHQIQVTGACFSSGQRYCSPIPPVTHHSLHTSQTPPLRLLW
ncbi:hypothetical protein AAFF_G00216640 [Aldrovandia affinis]|uniref:Uncharacterized protein n=1 Tax=Aldrovandia affinis TaxID=143900 RepID=A0AAD7W466_9TELE|nr:hypothetical protein AAFF_G00216640 [Aldrovandia affinis]